jgi:hypothetical protein
MIDTWNAWPKEIKGNGGKGEKTRVNRLLFTTDFSVRYFLGLSMVLMGEKVFALVLLGIVLCQVKNAIR